MRRDKTGDDRDVEPTRATRPGPQHKWLKPMRPDNPHRLRPGQTVVTFIVPKPSATGPAAAGDEPDGADG
jgi:hypothetical protein